MYATYIIIQTFYVQVNIINGGSDMGDNKIAFINGSSVFINDNETQISLLFQKPFNTNDEKISVELSEEFRVVMTTDYAEKFAQSILSTITEHRKNVLDEKRG